MANKLHAVAEPGSNIYYLVRDNNANVWNGSAFVSYNESNWSDYVNSMSEDGTCGYFTATFPSSISAGVYSIDVRKQVGASADASDTHQGQGTLEWTGTDIVDTIRNIKIDGISLESAIEMIMAVLGNEAERIDADTIVFKKRDGTTNKIRIDYGLLKGERTNSDILS